MDRSSVHAVLAALLRRQGGFVPRALALAEGGLRAGAGVSATGYSWQPHRPTRRPARFAESACMFFFFSNKLGWLGSIAISIVLTLLLLLLLGVF